MKYLIGMAYPLVRGSHASAAVHSSETGDGADEKDLGSPTRETLVQEAAQKFQKNRSDQRVGFGDYVGLVSA